MHTYVNADYILFQTSPNQPQRRELSWQNNFDLFTYQKVRNGPLFRTVRARHFSETNLEGSTGRSLMLKAF